MHPLIDEVLNIYQSEFSNVVLVYLYCIFPTSAKKNSDCKYYSCSKTVRETNPVIKYNPTDGINQKAHQQRIEAILSGTVQ